MANSAAITFNLATTSKKNLHGRVSIEAKYARLSQSVIVIYNSCSYYPASLIFCKWANKGRLLTLPNLTLCGCVCLSESYHFSFSSGISLWLPDIKQYSSNYNFITVVFSALFFYSIFT